MGANQHRGAHRGAAVVGVALQADLPGRLLRRYKRFLADVETAEGTKLTVHCPDPGSMVGLAVPGAAVRCSTSDSPRRRLRHTLEMIRAGRTWVGVNTARANDVVARALAAGCVRELVGYARIVREVSVAGGCRLDFRLEGGRRSPLHLEVKSVTLAEGTTARFPDSVTERGRRHLESLSRLARAGDRAALLFLVQRADCKRVVAAEDIDPAYGRALRAAARAGVELFALRARVTARRIAVERRLPVVL
jgi:sugar fermentation stimulation protein A